ncbi:MAG TPA: hypothetical protein VL049_25350 [Candidatus Dormibacteraeota bacterium]|nr:hypothetical protein [Candidatus Dormibacteraeota bacterium]
MLAAFLALQGVIVFAWWRRLAPHGAGLSAAERLLCAGVLAVAQIVAASLLLGWCGALSPRALLLLVVAITVAVSCVPLPQGEGQDEGVRPGAAPAAPSIWVSRANLALAALFLPTVGLIVVRGVLAPDFGWDGLRYHLPMGALMLQTGQLDFPPAHNPVIVGYPKAAEIWAHWILAFFGNDRWVGLAQLPFLPLAMLAIFCAGRRLGAGRAAATAGALLLPCAPVVLSQITVGYNDVVLSALLLVAVALTLAARQSVASALPLTLGATLGLLLGTKFTALVFAPLLYATFALVTWRARGRRALPGLAAAAALALLLGADTYLRNAWQHGNPVYPYQTTMLGRTLPGPVPDTSVYGIHETSNVSPAVRLLRSWSAVSVINASDLYGGFGAAAPLLVILVALSLIVAARERDLTRLWLLALFATLVALTPLNFRLRFVIYLLGLGGICLSHLLERGAPPARAALLAATLAVAAVTCAQLWSAELPRLRRARGLRPDACREAPMKPWRSAFLWVREHATAGSTVLTFPQPNGPFPYCLWTPTFSNRVEFANAESPAELERLAATRAGAFFFLPHASSAYSSWTRTDPGVWQTLFADHAVTIVTPATAPRAPM